MNTNTELPKNARILTKEEADDWDKNCSAFGPIFLEVDGEIREFERIGPVLPLFLGKVSWYWLSLALNGGKRN